MKFDLHKLVKNSFSFGSAISNDIHTSADESAAGCFADAFIEHFAGYNVTSETPIERRRKTEFIVLEAVNQGIFYAGVCNDVRNLEAMLYNQAYMVASAANRVFDKNLNLDQYCAPAIDFYNGLVVGWTSICE